jgi:GNAT superfamily N-acetyltransferase
MKIERLTFKQINDIWSTHLWPARESAIESHSAMTWPFEGAPEEYDMNVFKYPATFWGLFIDEKLVGVNSGHKTSDTQYRSRGIWIEPEHRGKGYADKLFAMTQHQAILEGCEMIWSIPRKTALPAYTKFGFETVGDYIVTETSDANIYVKLIL